MNKFLKEIILLIGELGRTEGASTIMVIDEINNTYDKHIKEVISNYLENNEPERSSSSCISTTENNTEASFVFSISVEPIKRTNMFKTVIEIESGNFVDYNFVSGLSNLLNVFCKNK